MASQSISSQNLHLDNSTRDNDNNDNNTIESNNDNNDTFDDEQEQQQQQKQQKLHTKECSFSEQPFRIHSELPQVNNNIQYSITFRPLQETDRAGIKKLHEELFPVEYTNHFYDSVVQNLGMDDKPLFSCIAIARVNVIDEENNSHVIIPTTTTGSSRTTTSSTLLADSYYDAWKRFGSCNGVDNLQVDGLYDRWLCNYQNNEHYDDVVSSDMVQGDDAIVACVVGTFIDVTNIGKDTVEQLVINPQRHTRMFYIMTLGSTGRFRCRGLGTKLINECVKICHQVPSCGVIYLHVITYNTTAIKFYERLGFHRIKEIENYYTINNEPYNCYLYAKFINGNRRSLQTILTSVYKRLLSYLNVS